MSNVRRRGVFYVKPKPICYYGGRRFCIKPKPSCYVKLEKGVATWNSVEGLCVKHYAASGCLPSNFTWFYIEPPTRYTCCGNMGVLYKISTTFLSLTVPPSVSQTVCFAETYKSVTNRTSALTVLLFSAEDVCKANYSHNKQRDRALNALILVTSVEVMEAWEESAHMCTNASFRQTCHSKMDQFRVLMKSGWGSSCVVVPMDAINAFLLNKRCNLGPSLPLNPLQNVP